LGFDFRFPYLHLYIARVRLYAPMPPVLYLIDGHALAYRTYFALTRGSSSAFTTSKGEPTAGVFGFTSVLLRILEQEKPDYLAVAFDTGRTFRDDLFAEYKGTRDKMPDDLAVQIGAYASSWTRSISSSGGGKLRSR